MRHAATCDLLRTAVTRKNQLHFADVEAGADPEWRRLMYAQFVPFLIRFFKQCRYMLPAVMVGRILAVGNLKSGTGHLKLKLVAAFRRESTQKLLVAAIERYLD